MCIRDRSQPRLPSQGGEQAVRLLLFDDALDNIPVSYTHLYAVRDIALDKSSLSLEAGQEETLNATITPWNAANQELIWESTDPAVAKIRPNRCV